MTRAERTFPVVFRLLAAAGALFVLAWLAPTAAAQTSKSQAKSELQAARQQYNAAIAYLDQKNAELQVVEARLADAITKVEGQEAALEQVTAQLLEIRRHIAEVQARYDRVHQQLNDRASQAFIEGPGSTLEYVLGSASMADLSDRLEFVDAVTQSTGELAQRVENLGYRLQQSEDELARLQEQRKQQVADAKALRDQIGSDVALAQQIRDDAAARTQSTLSTVNNAAAALKSVKQQFRQAAREAATSSSHTPVPLPAQYRDILKVCPVDQPRNFGDGFGAPRYAGGFHLHAGVDILANYDTAIRAPFDGVAHTSYNTLGGQAVYVDGAQGYVYNAHLKRYSALSNGPVHAGDIIGYVGDTGDAVGTPHDHFEFHPNFPVPSNWPTSYYGYRVIGTAVNPYPLLVAVCG